MSKLKGDRIELTNKTVATLSGSAPVGTVGYVTDDNGNLWFKNASGWKSITSPLGSAANPANSAVDIIAAGDSVGDGFYYITINGTTRQIWCDMTNDGGGWMMAARVHTSTDRWYYSDAYWTNTTLLNETQGPDYAGHVKNWVYTSFTFSQVRLAAGTTSNGLVESSWGGTSFSNFMTTGVNSSNSKTTWTNWMTTGLGTSPLPQANCNVIGTNKNYNYMWVKIGGTFNNEGDCSTNDSGLGFGIDGISPYTNTNPCGAFSSSGVNQNCVGYIFLK